MRVGFLVLLLKLGVKFVPALIKLLKGAKSLKVGLAVASFGLWELFFSWQFVVLLMATIFIHESGHVWAMRHMGMKTKGFYFVPLLGGAAVPDSMFPSRGAESYVAIMGPIWGGLIAVPTLAMWHITGNPLWAGITGWIAMVNLFNLLPALPLDGGRILRSIAFSLSRKSGFILTCAGIILGAYLSSKIGLALFMFIFIFGGLEILFEARSGKKARRVNAKIALLKLVFPTAKENEIILAFTSNDTRKFVTILPWDNMDRICNALNEHVREDLEQNKPHFAWEKAHKHSVMNEAGLINHQYHIASHILDWFYEDYDEHTYKLFQNPMGNWKIIYSITAYCVVAGLLYYTMYLTQHIPGSQAAFTIFSN